MLSRTGYAIVRNPLPGSVFREVRDLVHRLGVSHVLDVGAHHGEFATGLHEHARFDGHVISFEPSSENYAALAERARHHAMWTTRHEALGDVDGVSELLLTEHSSTHSLHEPSQYGIETPSLRVHVRGSEKVNVRRLDSIWPELALDSGTPMLKLDTQGNDLAVLKGCGEHLRAFHVVLLEASNRSIYNGVPQLPDYIGFMEANGFELTGAFPVRREHHHVVEFDCTFVHR